MGWIVYSKDGQTERCVLHKREYNGTFMGDRAVIATFYSEKKIDFNVFDYITYRGERFELELLPTVKKVSSREYKYELRFVSLKYELERCMMRNIVPGDNGIVYPTPLTVEFTGNVKYLTERIQACLDAMYGKGTWSIIIAEGTESEEKNISMSNQNCWDALSLVNTEYKLNYFVKERNVIIGGKEPVVDNVFEYGKGKGLYEIERISDTDTGVVTKLRAYGGTRNLDYSYPKLPEWKDSILPANYALSPLRLMLPDFKKDGKTDYVLASEEAIAKYGIREGVITYDDIYPSITGMKNSADQAIDEIKSVSAITNDTQPTFTVGLYDLGFDLSNSLTTDEAQLSMKSGSLQGYTFNITKIDRASDGSYTLTLGRNTLEEGDTGNFTVPNKDWNMKAGDKFVLLNILMPQEYIRDAENRLLARAKEYLAKYSSTNYSYNVGVDEIFMARNVNFYNDIMEGKRLTVNDQEIGINNENIIIQSLTIKEGEGIIPTFEVTLNNETTASTLDRIQGQISEVETSVKNKFSSQSELLKQYRQKLDKSVWDSIFVIHKDDSENPEKITSVQSLVGLWTDSFLSAKGLNPGSGSGSGEGGATVLYQLNDIAKNASETGVLGAAPGKVLTYGTDGKWYAADAVGLDETALGKYLTDNNYITSSALNGYATASSLKVVSDKLNDFLTGTDTDGIINRWKELEAFLKGQTQTSTLAELLAVKADKATTLSGYGITDAYTKSEINSKLNGYVTTTALNTSLAKKVDVAFLGKVFGFIGDNNSEISINDTNAVITSIKAKFGLWTDEYLSAKGLNPNVGGGTGGGATVLYQLNDVAQNANGTGVLGAEAGKVLTYGSDGKWYAAKAGMDEDALSNYLTINNYAKKSDIPSLDGYATITSVNSALSNKVDKVSGMGLSQNNFTDALFQKLNGIAEGANKYILPVAKAAVLGGVMIGSTLTASATGVLNLPEVMTAGTYAKVTTDIYGRVTGGSSLSAGDIPALSISKITGLQDALDKKVNKSDFATEFDKAMQRWFVRDIANKGLHPADYDSEAVGIYSDSYISAKGLNPGISGGDGATTLGSLNNVGSWADTIPTADRIMVQLSGATHWTSKPLSEIVGLDTTALADYLTKNNYATQPWVNTQLGGYATTASLKTVSDKLDNFLTGTDTDNIINKWKELESFLTGFKETDTLSGALALKVDKVAGKGLSTNDFTSALLTKLNGIEAGANNYTLPIASGSVLGGVKVGTTLAISSGVLNLKSGMVTAGTYTKVTVDTYGRITGGSSLSVADIPDLSGTYVTKAFFSRLFKAHKADGSDISVNDTSATIDNIEALFGLWTERWMSAKGLNPGMGGSEGGASTLGGLNNVGSWADGIPTVDRIMVQRKGETHWESLNLSDIGLNESQLGEYLTTNNYAKKSDIPSLSGYATEQWVKDKGYITSSALSGYATETWVTTKLGSYATASSLKTVSDKLDGFLTGTDTDDVINKWKELESFLVGFKETDTLAGALGLKANKTITISAGTGLSGGGTLEANRTISLKAATASTLGGIKVGDRLSIGADGLLTATYTYTLPTASASVLGGVKVGSTLNIASGVLNLKSGIVTAGTYFKTTVDTYGRVTAGTNPTTLSGFGITDGVNTVTVTGTGNAFTSVSISGHTITLTKATTFLTKAVFDDLFEKVNIGTSASPVYAIRAKYGLFTNEFMSAKGLNPGTGGGSGGGLIQSVYGYADLGKTFSDTDLTDTFNAYTINKLAGRITSLENSSITSVPWSIITNKPTTIAGYGITDAVRKTGDTMTGKLTITTEPHGEQLEIKRAGTTGNSVIRYSNNSGLLGHIGICGSAGLYPEDAVFNDKNGNAYHIWHSGNDGTGSGLDADLLDGFQRTRFVGGYSSVGLGSSGTAYTYREFISAIGSDMNFAAAVRRGSWSYADNGYITTAFGNLPLAGLSSISFGSSGANTTLFISASTNTGTSNALLSEMVFHIDNGDAYAPTWRRVLTNYNYNIYAVSLATNQTITGTKTFAKNIYFNKDIHIIDGSSANGYSMCGVNSSNVMLLGTPEHATVIRSTASDLMHNRGGTEYSIIDASNISKYSPTLSGSGATGTWNISINGGSNYLFSRPLGTDLNSTSINRNGIWWWSDTATNNPSSGANFGVMLQISNQNVPTGGTSNHWINQLGWGTNDRLYVRQRINTGNFTSWKQLAYTTDNVASATKLQTARTIWGQPFDGTGNVDGRITNTGGINVRIGSTDNWSAATIFSAGQYPLCLYYPGGTGNTRKYYFSGGANYLAFSSANDANSYVSAIATYYHNGNARFYHKLIVGDLLSVKDNRFNDSLAYYNTNTSSVTGTLCITLPNGWNNSMNIYEIHLYEYNGNTHSVIRVSGYNYASTPAWNNYGYEVKGGYNKGVRLGYNGSKCVILLGNTSSTWSYPQVFLKSVLTGYANQTTWYNDYSIGFITSESGYTNIVTVGPKSEWFGSINAASITSRGSVSITGDLTISGYLKAGRLKTTNICIECDNSGAATGRTSEINNYTSHLYLQQNTTNNLYVCGGGGRVGIGTTSPSTTYKLHVEGHSYTNGWYHSPAAYGYYIIGGVYYRSKDNFPDIYGAANEICFGSSTATFHVNYRKSNFGVNPTTWNWRAGSSTSWANFNLGSVSANGDVSATGYFKLGTIATVSNTWASVLQTNAGYQITTQQSVAGNTAQLMFGWQNVITSVGYITSYRIGSVRSSSGWGEMRFWIGNSDAKDSGKYLALGGSGSALWTGNFETLGIFKSNANGYTSSFGAQNANFCHIYTTAPSFYMDKGLSAATLTSRGTVTGTNFAITGSSTNFGQGHIELYGSTPYIDFHFNNSTADYTSRIIEEASGRLKVVAKLAIGQVNDTYALTTSSFYCGSWVRTAGSAGWYSEGYGGGIHMTDTTWVRVYNGKKFHVSNSEYNSFNTNGGFNRESYAGASWGNGYGALNVAITNNSNQTPLVVAYKNGSTPSAIDANRLFSLELLNNGTTLNFMFAGTKRYGMSSTGAFRSEGTITAGGDITAGARLTANNVNVNNKLIIASDGKATPYSTATRRSGMYGVYDSTKIGHIWSMGAAYVIADDGANFGSIYGFAYKHTNNTTGGTMAGGHQAVWCENGTPRVAIGTNFWVANNINAGGTIHATVGIWTDGYSSAKGLNTTSDMRLKNWIRNISIPIECIAAAPSFEYTWKDGKGGVEAGSSAQYWEKVIKPCVPTGPDGYLNMRYGQIALLSCISASKKILALDKIQMDILKRTETIEQKVDRLEKENIIKDKRIKELERRLS